MKNAPFSISALNGRNSGDLLDMIIKELGSNKIHSIKDAEDTLDLSIVGMPNVGKSSLANALLKKIDLLYLLLLELLVILLMHQ